MQHALDWSNVQQIIIILATFAVSFAVLFTLKRLLFRRLTKWAATKPVWYLRLIQQMQFPTTILVTMISLGVGLQAAPIEVREHPAAKTGCRILLILSIFWIIDRGLQALIRSADFSEKLSGTTKTLILTLSRIVVLALSIMIALDTMGISITPLLASLGVGSVAVALALQDTLSNFFSGMYILVDKPIRVGDTVGLDNQTIGVVRRIGWRSSQIEVGTANMVVIPNSKLASSVVTNYDLPSPEVNFTLSIGVSYSSNLDQVEKMVLDIAQQIIRKSHGANQNTPPTFTFNSFGESTIIGGLTIRVKSYGDFDRIRHELIKTIHTKFKEAGFEIPVPQRTVRFVQGEQSRAAIDARI